MSHRLPRLLALHSHTASEQPAIFDTYRFREVTDQISESGTARNIDFPSTRYLRWMLLFRHSVNSLNAQDERLTTSS